MIKKDRVYELKIDEEDDISGIDSISLVDEPAIEVNWVAFNKTKEEFYIPDGEDEKYVNRLLAKAELEEDLLNEGWEVDKIEMINKESFATNPNAKSEEDDEFLRVRYRYGLNPNIKQRPIISTTRDFCRNLCNKNYVWRLSEVENEINDFGQPAYIWRGGYNCRHQWFKIYYKPKGDITNKASAHDTKVTIGGFPLDLTPDWIQPDTVTNKTAMNPSKSTIKNLGLSKEEFDDSCPQATQDIATNLKNRQKAIDVAHYGPLNPNEPNDDYWKAKAKCLVVILKLQKKQDVEIVLSLFRQKKY